MTRPPRDGVLWLLLAAALAAAPADGPLASLRAAPLPDVAPRRATAPSQPLAGQVEAMSRQALQMAHKGMLFSAREELVQSLRLVAQAADAQQQQGTHLAALADALAALKEADDFVARPETGSAAIDVAAIARSHRTPVVKETRGLAPVVAQQHYFQFAQEQLAYAVAGEPAASQSLYALGKIQMALAGQSPQPQSLQGPRAMVFYQAALAVDAANYLAANELGVLLARYGQWPEARRVLLQSVSIRPHAEGWHNLAIVHSRLGETELARLAENERQLLIRNQSPVKDAATERVQWIDPQTFAARSPAKERR